MNKIGKKTLLATLCGAVTLGATVGIATSCSNSSSGTEGSILVYHESEWAPAYKKAVEIYNSQGNHKYSIELKTEKAEDTVKKVIDLGYRDAQSPDLIYLQYDKLPELASKKALLPFANPQELVNGQNGAPIIGSEVYGNDVNSFATKGIATVEGKDYYFGMPHNKEAIVMYYKGNLNPASQTFKQMYEQANKDGWNTTMAAGNFSNLYHSLGIIAGALNTSDGATVGNSLIRKEGNTFYSDMTKITAADANATAQGLKKAVDFISQYFSSTVPLAANSALGDSAKNDWLLTSFGTKAPEAFTATPNAAAIDGVWEKNKFKADGVKVSAVPNMDTGLAFTQAPGGWLYAINARNAKNYDKIDDMKSFVNILLSNNEVIDLMYANASKITYGNKGEQVLRAKYSKDSFDGQLIDAVLNSKTMNKRPDNGNDYFGNVWAPWGTAFDPKEGIAKLIADGVKADPANIATYEGKFVTAYQSMLTKLNA